jgi:hypothetical protein
MKGDAVPGWTKHGFGLEDTGVPLTKGSIVKEMKMGHGYVSVFVFSFSFSFIGL